MKNKSLRVLFLCNGIFVLAASLLGPLYAIYVEKLGKGILTISASWAVFLLSTTFFIFLISKMGDKVKKDYLLMAGFLLRAVIWIAFIFIGNITQLIILQIFLGLGEALGNPAFDAIFAEHLDKNKHVEEYADWQLVTNIVTAVGVLVGGLLVSSFGFSYLFLLMAILATTSFFVILFRPKQILLN